MKALNTYINEKLVLNKDTFKEPKYKYFPASKGELQKIIKQLLNERKDDPVIDLNDIDTSKLTLTDMSKLFFDDEKIINIDISDWNVSGIENMSYMFYGCKNLKSIGDISGWDISKVNDMSYMFYKCENLVSVGNLFSWDVSKVTTMSNMFYNCKHLKYIGDISSWDILKVKNMVFMFNNCEQLKDIGDLNKWNIKNQTVKIINMFNNSAIKNIPSWYKD